MADIQSLRIDEDSDEEFTSIPKTLSAEDFVRNFLVRNGLHQTFERFQAEWFEYLINSNGNGEAVEVPEALSQNQHLADEVGRLRQEAEDLKKDLAESKNTIDRMKKERDYYKLHYNRLSQEKQRLQETISKVKKQADEQEPQLKSLQSKFQHALKEKTLAQIDRDRLADRIESLESALKNATIPAAEPKKKEARVNKYEFMDLPSAKQVYTAQYAFQPHTMPVSSIKFHPNKMILATASDDRMWKLWSFPTSELLATGAGHHDWLADIDFSFDGNLIATASGDNTIRLWRLNQAKPVHVLRDHSQAVWSASFSQEHPNLLVSASMDHTAKIWDVETGKCKLSLRGHADSVNFAKFSHDGRQVITCSGDKTVSCWDFRSGICSHTFLGHSTAVNHVDISLRNDMIASCDAYGQLRLWDTRHITEFAVFDYGPANCPRLAFDPAASVVAIASFDGSIKLYDTKQGKSRPQLFGHDSGVQTVLFDQSAGFLVSGGADGVVKFWA